MMRYGMKRPLVDIFDVRYFSRLSRPTATFQSSLDVRAHYNCPVPEAYAVRYWPLPDIDVCIAHVPFGGVADMTFAGFAFTGAIGAKRT